MSIYSFFCRGNKTIFKLQSNPCLYFFKSAHGKKQTFSIISKVNKINRGKITKEGNQFGFELFEGYPGWVSRRFFLSPGVRRIEVDCQPAITSGSRNRGLPFEKLGMIPLFGLVHEHLQLSIIALFTRIRRYLWKRMFFSPFSKKYASTCSVFE